jgi:hypothetical protein
MQDFCGSAVRCSHDVHGRVEESRWSVTRERAHDKMGRYRQGKHEMSEFYVDTEDAIRRCQDSRKFGHPITITALTTEGKIKAHTGIVEFVESDERASGERRRVVMKDTI